MSSKETSSSAKQVSPFGAGSPRRLPMKVIVCGLGRTGTASKWECKTAKPNRHGV